MSERASRSPGSSELPPELVLAFAPLHKRHFGFACGAAAAVAVAGLTLIHVVRSPDNGYPLSLLSQFFAGYSVSFRGALVGGLWAAFVGFVAGWFLAFSRNLAIAVTIFLIRTRAAIASNRDFLDHI
jgi:hypothetical protein